MSIPANQAWSTTIRPSSIGAVSCTCGGVTVYPSVQNNGDGSYKLKFTAAQIFCDGPLEIHEGATLLEKQTLTGC